MNKKNLLLLSLLIFVVSVFLQFCTTSKNFTREQKLRLLFNQQIDSLHLTLSALDSALHKSSDVKELQSIFKKARLQYKEIELMVEYYFQGMHKRINGPALPDVKTEDGQVLPPHGFQVLEEAFFGDENFDQKELVNEVRVLKSDLLFVKNNIEHMGIFNRHIHEAIQHQFIRIATLGITGFDSPISLSSIEEARSSLAGIQKTFKTYYQDTVSVEVVNRLDEINNRSIDYLKKNNQFDQFNRMEFIKEYLIPASEAYYEITKELKQPGDTIFDNKFFDGSLGNLMQGQGFKPDAISPYFEARSNPSKIELGKLLFNDKMLSKNNDISCASCHQSELYFTDGRTKATNFVHGGNLERNTPSIYYSALQNNQFYDLRSNRLEDQIEAVMRNSKEFNDIPKEITSKIIKSGKYTSLIKKAFPKKDSINTFDIQNAIASYIRSLNPFSSNFDAYMKGDKNAMNQSEINGFNLFSGKAKCATCHFIPLFNGTIPPWFNKTESEVIGVPQNPDIKNAKIDGDLGRYLINQFEELKYAFKTPTSRNIAFTAPYMHNGVYKTLEQVVEFYNLGGGKGIGIDLPHQTLPEDKLNLTAQEQKDLVAFLKTLSDKKTTYSNN